MTSCVTPASQSSTAPGSGAWRQQRFSARGGVRRGRRSRRLAARAAGSLSAAAVARRSLSTVSCELELERDLGFVEIVRGMPRVDDAKVVFTSIASPNACHTQGHMPRIEGGQNGSARGRGEETGNESTLAMNGAGRFFFQSARWIARENELSGSFGHHKHKRRWGGASRCRRLGHLAPEDQDTSLSPLTAATHRPRSTVCTCGSYHERSGFVPCLSRAMRCSTSHRQPARGHDGDERPHRGAVHRSQRSRYQGQGPWSTTVPVIYSGSYGRESP